MINSSEFSMDTRKLNPNAHQKLSTLNPSINLSVIITIHALITQTNKPSVITVNGSVSSTIIGFKMVLTIASTTATPMAVIKLFIFIPFIRDARTKITMLLMSNVFIISLSIAF